MNRPLVFTSLALLSLCFATVCAGAGEPGDEPLIGANVEALQSAMEQYQRDPQDEAARQQLIELLPGWLSQEELQSLEARLEIDPQDLAARERLIGHYKPRVIDESARHAYNRHLLWMIRNTPQADLLGYPGSGIQPFLDPESYRAGKEAWLRHIQREPGNVKFLGHAARFLSPFQDRDLIIDYLKAAQSIDTDNPDWPYALGQLYLRGRMYGGASNPAHALEQFRQAYDLAENDMRRSYFLGNLVEAAFEAKRHDDVRSYATTMLDTGASTEFGSRNVHHAHTVLGRVALAEDDVELAKYHLLEATRFPESSSAASREVIQLQGPDMRLASELLKRGEREVVLEYFDLCATFWRSDRLDEWAAVVKAGGMPDFRFNPVGYR